MNTILCIFHWHTEQKDILSIKIFTTTFSLLKGDVLRAWLIYSLQHGKPFLLKGNFILLSKGWHRDMVRLIKTLCCNLIRLRRLVLPTQTGLFWNYTFYFHNTTTGTRYLDWLVGDLVIR